MNPSLREFRGEFLDRVLDLLWRQWTALGVSGYAEESTPWIVDPEAVLLATCCFGRYEPRLFDESLDCLRANGWVMNTQRMATLLRDEAWSDAAVLGAVAGLLSTGTQALKWRRLSHHLLRQEEPEVLFRFKDGRPMPVVGEPEPHFAAYGLQRDPLRRRGNSQPFRPLEAGNLLVQLRALCGVNVRPEVVAYLLTHETGHPAEIARAAYYHKRTIQDVLVEMSRSGVVESRQTGREKRYWVRVAEWKALLRRSGELPRWVCWPPLWSALEQIWLKLNDPQLDPLEPLMISSVLRQLILKVRPAIERAGFDKVLSDDRHHLGESYLPVFLSDITKLLQELASGHGAESTTINSLA
jgi:hypothetical protein